MKKYLYSIVLFLALFISNEVYAASFDMSLVGNNTFENEITINLQVGSLTEFNGFCGGLCGFEGVLNYDTEKIELVSIEGLAGFDLTDGPKKVLYKTTGVGKGTNIMKMVFKNKSLRKDESATISLTNTSASDGDKDVTGKDISKTIKLTVKEETKPNTNTNTDTNNNNNSTSTTTNKKEEEKKSDNSYLSSITLSKGTIDFNKNTLLYDVIVPYETETIEITAKSEHEKTTIEGVGEHKLNVGANKIELTVKAEDESVRKYTITVNREKENIVVEEDETEKITECPKEDNSNNLFAIVISIIAVIELGTIIVLLMKNKQR